MNAQMKIVVIGGTGLIGSKTVALLREAGHEVVAAAPNTGVNTLTGEGLDQALAGANVVIDVSNAPSWEPDAVMDFFKTSSSNLLAAEAAAGVSHHIALSIVGTDRMVGNGYFDAKVAQESIIKQSQTPYTIVRATQFFEFLTGIADGNTVEGSVHLAGGAFQPIAADDVAAALVETALNAPQNGTIEIAGPDREPFDAFVRRHLALSGDTRPVVLDPDALYFGGRVQAQSLVPLGQARLGKINLAAWIERKSLA